MKFDDAAHPAEFNPRSRRPVRVADYAEDGFAHVTGYKDPVVFWERNRWHLFVIGADRVERLHYFTSQDSKAWKPAGHHTG